MRPRLQSTLAHPLNDVLGTQAGVRVLRVLARHGGPLSAPLTARHAALSAAVARMTLADLTVVGVVAEVGQGRAVSYQLDHSHPLVPALEHLFHAEAERRTRVLDGLRDAAAVLDPAPLGVWVYGSVARGEDMVASDLDVALCVADPSTLGRQTEVFREAAMEIGERERVPISVISLTADDAVRLAREGAPIWGGIVRDGFPLVGRAPETIAPLAAERT